jgi:hypothetical protein
MSQTTREAEGFIDEEGNEYDLVDKGARGDVSSLAARVATLEAQPAPQDGQDGADGKSISVKSATKSNGVTTVVLTDGTTDTTLTINDGTDGQDGQDGTNGTNGTDGQDGQDGITPAIKPNSGNTVSLVNGVYTLAQNATEHVYRIDVSYGSGDERNFTTPNLLYGTDAILEAVDAIMNEQPASVAVTNE